MPRGNRGLIGAGVLAIVLGVLPGSVLPLQNLSAKAAPAIGFSTPNVMDPMESVGEPTIVQSPASDNTVYASGPWGTGTQRSIWNASADLGETFRLVQQCAATSSVFSTGPCPGPTGVSGTASPPGGGDTDQRLDSSGKDYFDDLWALACLRVATTADHGATANQNAYGCNGLPTTTCTTSGACRPDGADRQWLSVFDPALTGVTTRSPYTGTKPLIYQEYNNLQTVQVGCSYWVKSTDGLNYTAANNLNGNFGCDGYPSVDQTTGKVFEASGCTVSNTPSLCLNIGTPDANGNLCFLDDSGSVTIDSNTTITCPNGGGVITVASGLAGDPDLLFTVSSMDTGRNLHITYAVNGAVTSSDNGVTGTSTYQVFTTVAPANNAAPGVNGCTTDCWNHWATPVQVSLSPSNVNVFPWMVAGGPGRSDSVWYGTSSFIDPSTNGSTIGSGTPQAWNVYMDQVAWPVDGSGAVTLAAPSRDMVLVSPHPSHYNSICLQGTGCITSEGDRNLADFFTVTIDHNGAAEVEYDDTSNGLIQSLPFDPTTMGGCISPCGIADHPGAPVVTIARQDSGPGIDVDTGGNPIDVTTRPAEPTSSPVIGQTDPAGDGLYPVIGGSPVNAFDFVNNHSSGLANQLTLNPDGSLTVKMTLDALDGTSLVNASTTVTGTQFLQYVTRWVLCGPGASTSGNCLIYYVLAETQVVAGNAGAFTYWGGQASSLDLCSVSACDPHVEVYPDAPAHNNNSVQTGGFSLTGSLDPSTNTFTVTVPGSDIGNPSQSSLLEEVGSYSFGSDKTQSTITNADAESDLLPLEIDGVCCFNFQGSALAAATPEVPWTPALLAIGVVLIGAGAWRRRRSNRKNTSSVM